MAWIDRINPQIHVGWSGSWATGVIEPPRQLVDHEVVVVGEGSCDLEVASVRHRVDAGRYLLIPPGTWHHTRVASGPCLRHCLHFDWSWSGEPPPLPVWRYSEVAAQEQRPMPEWIPAAAVPRHGEANEAVIALAQRATVSLRSGRAVAARAALLELLAALFARSDDSQPVDRTTTLAWQVKARLDQSALENRSVRSELRALGHSYEHLCRCFVRTFGIAPLRYVQLARMEAAKALLLEPGATVADVAAALGYQSPGHFAKVFRTVTGVSPGRWAG